MCVFFLWISCSARWYTVCPLGHCWIYDLVLWTGFCTPLAVGDHGLWCSLSLLVYWTSPWRRKWQHTPVFLPGKSRGQRSLVNYSSWGHKEADTIEWLNTLNLCCLFASVLHLQSTSPISLYKCVSCSFMSNSLRPHGLYPARLFSP